jgi:hypothetical protein
MISSNDKKVDENLKQIQDKYGKEYLEGLSDREFYNLYKTYSATNA